MAEVSRDRDAGAGTAWGVAKWLSVIGALNWGLVGFFDWDLVRAIFGGETATPASGPSRVIYAIVGLAGLGLALLTPRHRRALADRTLSDAEARA